MMIESREKIIFRVDTCPPNLAHPKGRCKGYLSERGLVNHRWASNARKVIEVGTCSTETVAPGKNC